MLARRIKSARRGAIKSEISDTLLDSYEGVPDRYRRDLIEVLPESGPPKSVWTYLAIPQDPPGERQPHRDYIAHYISGAAHFKLPKQYIEFLQSVSAGVKRS
jgi:hypothetical protein